MTIQFIDKSNKVLDEAKVVVTNDVNGDGMSDIFDLIALAQYLAETRIFSNAQKLAVSVTDTDDVFALIRLAQYLASS